MKRLVPLLAAACASAAPKPAAPPGSADLEGFAPGATAAAAGIRADGLAAHIRFLADDLLEGRAPGTRGYDVAARYVATQLQGLGVQPAGEGGTYFQKVELVGATLRDGTASLEIAGGPGPRATLERGRDYAIGGDPSRPRVDVEGELVFVGHGLTVPEYRYDDFAAVDVRGKIVVYLVGTPRPSRADFFPPLPAAVYGDTERILRDLERRGAAGAIAVWTPLYESMVPFVGIARHIGFERMVLASDPPLLPGALLSSDGFAALLRQAGRDERLADLVAAVDRGARPFFALGLRAHLRSESEIRTLTSENVVGVVPGDPASPRRDEVVVYGAHLDHMGVGEPVNGDRIYNGASDDAAGVASLLETARAVTRLGRPAARSIVFLFVTAEERGLLGSRYYADHPTVPLAKIVADIDVDGAYPIRPLRDVVAIGTDQSSLAADVDRAAAALGLAVSPDPSPDEAYFVRSDNYNFVKQGIPAAQTLNGRAGLGPAEVAADELFWRRRYHQPQDEYEPDRDFRPFADLTRFDFLLGLSIAERPGRPTWNASSWFRRFPEKK